MTLLSAGQLHARDVVSLFDASLADSSPSLSVVYKSIGEEDLQIHLFEPGEGIKRRDAALLWIHGGGWNGGSAEQLFPHCAYFARLGYVTASIDYRLARGGATLFDCVDDVRDAFYWLVENADALGVDPDQIVVCGESSGGHLAACIGYIEDTRTSGVPVPQPRPVATVLVNSVTDLIPIDWAMSKPGIEGDEAMAESISPAYHVDPSDPPALLLHGTNDTVVPLEQSSDFASGLHALNIPANLRLWQDKGHAFFLYLPEYSLTDKAIIQLSLLQIEAFLQMEGLNGYPVVHGHFAPVHLFDGTDGFRSFSELVPIGDWLFGSTYLGGTDDLGVLFRFDPTTRAYSVLHEFNGADGKQPFTGFATDGTRLYGVAKFGGAYNNGTLYSMNLDGTGFTVLHEFHPGDKSGYAPHAAPVLVDGVLYGTTFHGGTSDWGGVLYKYPLPSGPYERIHSFVKSTGRHPTGQLLRIGDWLYGTASDLYRHDEGDYGSLYRIHRSTHEFQLLHRFDDLTEGSHPYDDLVYDGVDTLFGTTFGSVVVNPVTSRGTVFAYSIGTGSLTVLHDFSARPGTGSKPNSALALVDGRLYGISHGFNSPAGDRGTLFSLLPDGIDFQLYHTFEDGLLGNTPMRALTYYDKAFYGVAVYGGLTTDVANLNAGPGFIFRYQPETPSTDTRTAYIRWLATADRLINQDPHARHRTWGLSLLEAFTYGMEADAPGASIDQSFTRDPATGAILSYSRVRADMTGYMLPEVGTNLQIWEPSTHHATEILPDPESGTDYRLIQFTWSPEAVDPNGFFARVRIGLPD